MSTRVSLFYFSLAYVLCFGDASFFGIPKLCLCRCGLVQTERQGILFRKTADVPSQFPWVVTINTGNRVVQGSLLTDQHIITAAEPVYGVPITNLTVNLGVYDRCRGYSALNSDVSEVTINPSYAPANLNNNLALIKLRYPVTFSDSISPVCLPYYGLQEYDQVCWTASWALSSANASTCIPRVATVPTLPAAGCYHGTNDDTVTQDKACFVPLGAGSILCNIDIGAPVLWRFSSSFPYRLVGVISSSTTCEDTKTPLYTRVIDHITWIRDVIQSDCNCI
ncbi:chymotrypsinogen B-like [Galleria mellonella]|uniref:Chymotrypsinogen B-like n=1 Tax=Galleria mellonella TaxID=7137 RepID=A0ABM3MAQ9_GALME|nr:chymotrypsinogen B-like [Galleria mellonella]